MEHLTTAADRLAGWLPDTCIIRERGTSTVDDDYPYDVIEVDGAEIYNGPCFLQGTAAPIASGHTAGENILTETHRVRVPATVTPPPIGAIVEVTASERDPSLVGIRFTVADHRSDTALVSRLIALRTVEKTARVD